MIDITHCVGNLPQIAPIYVVLKIPHNRHYPFFILRGEGYSHHHGETKGCVCGIPGEPV